MTNIDKLQNVIESKISVDISAILSGGNIITHHSYQNKQSVSVEIEVTDCCLITAKSFDVSQIIETQNTNTAYAILPIAFNDNYSNIPRSKVFILVFIDERKDKAKESYHKQVFDFIRNKYQYNA